MRSHDLDLEGTLGQSRSSWATPSDWHLRVLTTGCRISFLFFTSSLDMSKHIFCLGLEGDQKKIMHQSGWIFFTAASF